MGKHGKTFVDLDEVGLPHPSEQGLVVREGANFTDWETTPSTKREAAVIKLEVMPHKETVLSMLILTAAVVIGVGSDIAQGNNAWTTVSANGPYMIEEKLLYTANITASKVDYLSLGRLRVHFEPKVIPHSFTVTYDSVFYDEDGEILVDVTDSHLITCSTQAPLRGCDSFSLPQFPYVWLPEHGPLYANVSFYNYNATIFDTQYIDVDLEIYDHDSMWSMILVRFVSIVTLIAHVYYYKRSCVQSVDTIRPEHSLWGLTLVFCILYCNPFFPLAMIQRTGRDIDELVAFLVFQVPLFFTHYIKAAMWGLLVAISKGTGTSAVAAMYSRLAALFALLFTIQIVYIALNGTCFAVLSSAVFTRNSGRGAFVWFAELMYSGVSFLLIGRVAVGLFCCCRCGVKQQLRHHPYYPSRDRQLLVRLMIFMTIIVLFSWLASSLASGQSQGTLVASAGHIVLAVVSMHFVVYCGTPVFLKGQTDKPPSPMTDEWKTTKWQPEWFNWIVETPGTRCLYVFMTSQEEEAFWAMQDPPQDWRWRMFIPFNYEACAWSLFFARNSYRLDFLSPTVSAVVAAIAIVRSTSDTSYKKAGPRKADSQLLMSVSTKRFDVVRVVHMAGMQVILGVHDEHFVVAFRGSSNLQNWKDDLTFPRVPWDEMMKETGFQRGEENGYCFTSVPLVHSGFLSVWKAVDQTIVSVIERYSEGRPLVVTGHSLGAALATLASFSLSLRYPERRMAVWTYGSPLVGNKAFARVYRSVVKYCFRVVNENDLITRAVFTLGNSHVGTLVTLAAANGMLTVDPPFFERLVSPTRFLCSSAIAHSIAQYRTALYQSFLISSSDPSQFRCLPE